MRLIKLIFISAIIFFLLLTAISSLFPSNVVVARDINIAVNADSVKPYLSQYSKWNEWMEGAKTNELKVVAADSNKAYFGTIIITLLNHDSTVWRHEWKGRGNLQISILQITSGKGNCIVSWRFEQHLHWYPWEKFGSLMNDKIIGSSMEKSLDNLKALVEHTMPKE